MWPLIVTNSVEKRSLTVGLAIFAQISNKNGCLCVNNQSSRFTVFQKECVTQPMK